MTTEATAEEPRPSRIESPGGLVALVNANGSLARLSHGDVVLNLFPASEVEGGPANLYLRRLGDEIESTPLLGPCSPLSFRVDADGLRAAGEWHGLYVELVLLLAESAPAWFWRLAIENRTDRPLSFDVVHAQDVALAAYGAIRLNEYYVSQYLDFTPLAHPQRGCALAVRQNLAVDGRQPWCLFGSLRRGVSFATDALQLHGLATRAGEVPAALAAASLPGVRRQHEHAMAVIQDAAVDLAPGAAADLGFFAWFEADHAAATTDADVAAVDRALALPEASAPCLASATAAAATTLFAPAAILCCRDLRDDEIRALWGSDLRHLERDGERTLSFFTGAETHVVLRAKELRVLRPHGQLLRTGDALVPDETSLTTTVYMNGVFNSLLTQGHVSINRFLSTTHTYLGLQKAHGQRIFVEGSRGFELLDVPSAWEISPNASRWIYACDAGVIEVRLAAAIAGHALELSLGVRDGTPRRFLISHHVALNGDDGSVPIPVRFTQGADGIDVRAVGDSDVGRRFPDGFFRIAPFSGTAVEAVGGDEMLFRDGRSRQQPYLVLRTAPTATAGLRFTGHLLDAGGAEPVLDQARADRTWNDLGGRLAVGAEATSPLATDVAHLHEILPWFMHDALIHYLAPRGLEQYSGGGWGTRDVTQGPVELLLALGRWEPIRDLLSRVFANQNADGDWPQWFMFFERERGIRPGDSHGDIVFWPLHSLAEYLLASEDASILDVSLPFFAASGEPETATVWGHVERALQLIARRVIPGTHLAVYGHGDWNDSLQPADPAMRERLCSTWTVILHEQTLSKLAAAMRRLDRGAEADRLEALAVPVRADFRRLLLPDGELPGFAYFREDGRVDYLLHPRDQETGIHHRLLPMIHAIIADLLTPEEAAAHIDIMRTHLLGVDGARLFDHPPPYRGGPQQHFQRAESSTYFGREIGLMYTHAHLRYAEAMARHGDADAFFEALRRAVPIGIGDVVAAARPRQANCYYSSSDADVADRYEAATRYADIRAGRVPLEGGWRVYSSGAGIAVRLIHHCFLGLRLGRSQLGIDPVIPKALDGLRAELALDGHSLRVLYRIAAKGCGPRAVTLNGEPLSLTRGTNRYRTAGVSVEMEALRAHLVESGNELVIDLE